MCDAVHIYDMLVIKFVRYLVYCVHCDFPLSIRILLFCSICDVFGMLDSGVRSHLNKRYASIRLSTSSKYLYSILILIISLKWIHVRVVLRLNYFRSNLWQFFFSRMYRKKHFSCLVFIFGKPNACGILRDCFYVPLM